MVEEYHYSSILECYKYPFLFNKKYSKRNDNLKYSASVATIVALVTEQITLLEQSGFALPLSILKF